MSFLYKKVFRAAEDTLLTYGSHHLDRKKIQAALDHYKTFENRELTDELCYSILVEIVFYSGFRSATVTAKLPIIKGHFSSIEKVAAYTYDDLNHILADTQMIRHEGRINACIKNAKAIKALIKKHGSFSSYLESFKPKVAEKNLITLKKDMQKRFSYIGPITAYHFLTDLGFDVLKPDLVICRIFKRLGLIESQDDYVQAINHGRKFAEATGKPIRYIDIVFVAYGQVRSIELGMDRGICLINPRCEHCGLTQFCEWYKANKQ